ncbi:plant UBX domain-containing protein 11-like isoform X2 [Populus alba x Populus x berolinensis]|uniref:Plant UBX domain-containing protein 11-like isoform X2 n=1 Tax=Populus alba x Populus x berolinensis TaxID=444605 RepID=A0AAD6VXS5_9ROSI|nr:plant UBX domain-containing protein 11-like isoform X2 [Populus alba x Populus x berolinensis]
MRSSISSFTYKGSIAEAILESKKQKKLFVVYISGENVASAELGKSTWTDSKVAESLSKYCILLHFSEGSNDALNFSAIYRQKSAPCITAIGYNGVQLWQSEGFVTAEVLASALEKAWLTLHIQETTASTVLTTALALKKPEPPSGSSDIGSSGQGSSSGTVIPVPLKDRHIQPSEVGTQAAASEVIEENKSHEPTAEKSQTVGDERSTCPTEEDKKSPSSSVTSTDNIIADHTSSADEDGLLAQEKSVSTGVPTGGLELSTAEIKEVGGDKKAESMDDMVPGTLNNNKKVNVSSDAHLNIRLPDGVSLQEKFSVTSTLRMVKDFVDRNQASGIGAYDLAIPYPRKTFSDQDLNKSLSELSLLNRQALIVVPRQRATSYHQRGSLSDRATTTTSSGSVNANDWGYFACVKRLLSYVNPLSYFVGSANSSSSGQTQSAIGEYGPDSTSQNNTPRVDRPYSSYSPNQNSPSTGINDSKGKQPTTSRVGSNIHTLKHDEDDGRFSERNSFWNGNSTQYGGDNDAK